jgi:hypothetical protein
MAAIKIVATSLHQRRSRFAGREPFSDQALPAPQIIDALRLKGHGTLRAVRIDELGLIVIRRLRIDLAEP